MFMPTFLPLIPSDTRDLFGPLDHLSCASDTGSIASRIPFATLLNHAPSTMRRPRQAASVAGFAPAPLS